MIIGDRPTLDRIDEIFAFVCVDDTGEGIAAKLVGRHWMPLLGADAKRVASLRALAQEVADESGKPVKLLRFTAREELETIEPRKT